jgi:hypothetical protein
VRGKGTDQGGRWSVGIWFALVGVSAGTVASFSLIGWTFTQGLYDGDGGAEPLEFHSETVVIEAGETPAPEGVAGGDELDGLIEPGSEPDAAASPAEPRAERVQEDAEDAPEAPAETPGDARPEEQQHEVEETEPPQLVPVDEDEHDGDCEDEFRWPETLHALEVPILLPLIEATDVDLDLDPTSAIALELDLLG